MNETDPGKQSSIESDGSSVTIGWPKTIAGKGSLITYFWICFLVLGLIYLGSSMLDISTLAKEISRNTVFFIPVVIAMVSVVYVSCRTKRPAKWLWAILALGLALWISADMCIIYYQMFLGMSGPERPIYCEIFYITAYFLLFIAISMIIRASKRFSGERIASMIKFLAMWFGLLTVAAVSIWFVLLDPLYQYTFKANTVNKSLYSLYVVLDIAIIMGILLAFSELESENRRKWQVSLGIGLICFILSDLFYSFLAAGGVYSVEHTFSNIVLFFYGLGYFLIFLGSYYWLKDSSISDVTAVAVTSRKNR